jgi:lipopolysaccharide export system permease protein
MSAYIPQFVPPIINIAVFLSVMLCFGKFFANNEMFVTLACGVTWGQVIKYTMKPILVFATIAVVISLFISPYGNRTFENVSTSIRLDAILDSLQDGKVITPPAPYNDTVLYIDSKKGNQWKNIFLFKQPHGQSIYNIVSAPEGEQITQKYGLDIILTNANFYTFNEKTNETTAGSARHLTYSVYNNTSTDPNITIKGKSVTKLIVAFISGSALDGIELLLRTNVFFVVLVSGLLALSMCRIAPRRNKYSKLLPAVIVFAIYLSSSMVLETYIGNRTLPFWCLYITHIMFGSFAIFRLKKQDGKDDKILVKVGT